MSFTFCDFHVRKYTKSRRESENNPSCKWRTNRPQAKSYVRRDFSRHCAGVSPVAALNTRRKSVMDEKPQ